MTEFKRALDYTHLSQAEVSRMLDVTPATVNRWYKGTVPAPKVYIMLLYLFANNRIAFDRMLAMYELANATPIGKKPVLLKKIILIPSVSGTEYLALPVAKRIQIRDSGKVVLVRQAYYHDINDQNQSDKFFVDEQPEGTFDRHGVHIGPGNVYQLFDTQDQAINYAVTVMGAEPPS